MTRTTTPFSFPNGRGETLAGLIDAPGGAPLFAGVFGPCFTCVKESHAAAKICRALADRGGLMLRFDTTGFGASGGDPKATDFSSRVADFLAASAALAARGTPPRLLAGHSFSGTAAIAAAAKLPGISAVATVCSPADSHAVVKRFRDDGLMRETADGVVIDVLGTPYTFGPGFVPDLLAHDVAADTQTLARAGRRLFIFHAPNDAIVPYANAPVLAERAGAAGELVTLSPACNHLFSGGAEDAEAVAERLAGFFNK